MKFIATFFVFYGLALCLYAQGLPADTTYRPQPQVRAAYVGSLIYPGILLQVDYPLRVVKKERVNKQSEILSRLYKEKYVSGQFMTYYHPSLHSNFMLSAHWLARQQMRGGWFSDLGLGLGLARTFYTSPTYTVDAQGNAKRVFLAGNFYALGSLDLAVGYNPTLRKSTAWSYFLRASVLVFFPANSLVYPRPMLAIGATYHLGKYWQAKPKYISKTRLHKPLFRLKKKQ